MIKQLLSDVDCGKVAEVPNGSLEYVNGSTHLGSEIAYSCSRNHRLNGSPRRYCLDSGTWSDASPKCEGRWVDIGGAKLRKSRA